MNWNLMVESILPFANFITICLNTPITKYAIITYLNAAPLLQNPASKNSQYHSHTSDSLSNIQHSPSYYIGHGLF